MGRWGINPLVRSVRSWWGVRSGSQDRRQRELQPGKKERKKDYNTGVTASTRSGELGGGGSEGDMS